MTPRSAGVGHLRRRIAVLGLAALTMVAASGCGTITGPVFTIEMFVDPGPEELLIQHVSYRFAGTEQAYDFQHGTSWRKAANVGFGESYLTVFEPPDGTVCRILVDGVEFDRQIAEGADRLDCGANAQ
ncbi:hypothetical protein [Actinoalloteichus hymeniacidonis]|uniref:Mycobacterium membrane protein n=1 Tax=Actinoalloteichus hymeniacidonis TaxID=340345 RepID=A0AAC9HMK8_9PSEU|nr:hypothetical protein [Actinoalloteichus hymeniacidonis]AOS62097.1 hypothetical protein TL08_06360 [Actinoalloteichus hymeniacidonis]MBB5909881.1 hypothetical protein [Actinoalloteichus hymeniacidonis]